MGKATQFDFSGGGRPVMREVEVDDAVTLDLPTMQMLQRAGVSEIVVDEGRRPPEIPDGMTVKIRRAIS